MAKFFTEAPHHIPGPYNEGGHAPARQLRQRSEACGSRLARPPEVTALAGQLATRESRFAHGCNGASSADARTRRGHGKDFLTTELEDGTSPSQSTSESDPCRSDVRDAARAPASSSRFRWRSSRYTTSSQAHASPMRRSCVVPMGRGLTRFFRPWTIRTATPSTNSAASRRSRWRPSSACRMTGHASRSTSCRTRCTSLGPVSA